DGRDESPGGRRQGARRRLSWPVRTIHRRSHSLPKPLRWHCRNLRARDRGLDSRPFGRLAGALENLEAMNVRQLALLPVGVLLVLATVGSIGAQPTPVFEEYPCELPGETHAAA